MLAAAQSVDRLSATFAALADPTRRAILAQLARGEATVGELATPFSLSGPAVTKHLKVLQRAGLIVQGRDRQFRPCRIQPEPLREAKDWADQFRQLWEARLDRLDAYLQSIQSEPGQGAQPLARLTQKDPGHE